MSNDLTVKTTGAPAVKTMDDLARLAEMLSKSGYFKDATSAAQAGVKVLCGLELGIPAFASMAGIHIVSGKPAIGANLMAAKVKASDKYDYRVKEMTDEVCTIVFLERGEEIGVSTFTKQDATRAGTQNMGKFPRNMLYARAMSNGVKWFAPDIFIAPVYTPEELGATVDAEGDVVTVEVVAQPESPPEPAQPAVRPEDSTAEPVGAKAKPTRAANTVWMAWRKADDAVLWAVDQTDADGTELFNHHNHAQASFNKAKEEYGNSLTDAEKPKPGDSHEAKWAHTRALFEYFFERTEAKKRGERLLLPTAGSQRIFEPFDANEAVGVEALS